MADGRTRRVFAEMLREEWRLHSHLFGGGRFALFPALVAGLTAGTAWLLAATGTEPGATVAGLHALVFVFGLHTGSIAFVGRDALRNLLGEVNLLVFTARTLPLSQDRLLAVFVVKDAVYYSILFLAPVSVGASPAVFDGAGLSVRTAGTVPFLWATLALTFVLGMGATVAGIGISQRGVPGAVVLVAAAGVVGAALVGGVDIVGVTPYGLFRDPSLPRAGAAVALVGAAFAVGAVTFDATGRRSVRTAGPSFRRWWRRVGDPLAAKTLLDLHRSAGGVGKVLFSAAVLLAVTAGLVDLAGQITGVAPSAGVSFGAVLGLSGFTTYNWLTQFDDADSYLVHPVDVAAVFGAKFRAFLVLGPLVGLGAYALALLWRGAPVGEAVVGGVLLVGVACYIFGTTVYLTGLSPNEFLFDSALFGVFGAAMAVPLVPVLVVGFAFAPVPAALLAALGVGGAVLGLVGVALYRRSVPKWTARYRR